MSNGVRSLFHRDGKSEGGTGLGKGEEFSLGYGVVLGLVGHTRELCGQ